MPSGELPAGKWTKVISGWGWYELAYSIRATGPEVLFRTYPVYSSGRLPSRVTHAVRVYGDIWLYSPSPTHWDANPLSP
jgi:hypothetical protein